MRSPAGQRHLPSLSVPGTSKYIEAFQDSVLESIRGTLGALVLLGRESNFDAPVKMSKSGQAAVYMVGWRSDRRDFGCPSLALGLAHDITYDPGLRAMVEKGDINAVEQWMLDKALLIPLIFI